MFLICQAAYIIFHGPLLISLPKVVTLREVPPRTGLLTLTFFPSKLLGSEDIDKSVKNGPQN